MARKNKYQRLTDFIIDYFPDVDDTQQDIREWARREVPAWDYIGERDKKVILDDWRDFVKPDFVEKALEAGRVAWEDAQTEWREIRKEFRESVIDKVKGWFKRLFK